MSTGAPTPLRPREFLTPTTRMTLWIWATVIVGASILYYFTRQQTATLRRDITRTQSSIEQIDKSVQAGNPALASEVGQVKQETEDLLKRIESLEGTLGGYDSQFRRLEDKTSEAESNRAVERAKIAALEAQVTGARQRLSTLKEMQSKWKGTTFPSLMEGDLGQRIAASPPHSELVFGVLDQQRPTDDQLLQWQLQLDELADPVNQATQNKDSEIVITAEHAQRLSDLNTELSKSLAAFAQQQRMVDAIKQEVASLPPHAAKLKDVYEDRQSAATKASQQRINAALEAARQEAEQAQVEHLKGLQQEVIDAETKHHAKTLAAEKDQKDRLGQLDTQQVVEQTQLQEALRRTTIAQLKDAAKRVNEALAAAELAREFERAQPDIETYLLAFTAEGYKYRQDGTKGPASLGYLIARGILASDEAGVRSFHSLAVENNDRPFGAIPGSLRIGFRGCRILSPSKRHRSY